MSSLLPDLPQIQLRVDREVENASARGGFVDIRRYVLRAERNGGASSPFQYDIAERKALDAAVIVPHALIDGATHVYLRSSVRPPLALRAYAPFHSGSLWELPAGLIEVGEEPQRAAQRELNEEVGFDVPLASLLSLGGLSSPAPALIGEIHHYFHVNVTGLSRTEPAGDGSPLEEGARILCIRLADALRACRAGEVLDAKTELALRRLAEIV